MYIYKGLSFGGSLQIDENLFPRQYLPVTTVFFLEQTVKQKVNILRFTLHPGQ